MPRHHMRGAYVARRRGERWLLLCQGEIASGEVAVDRSDSGGRRGACCVGVRGCGGRGLEELPDASGEVALEAAQRLAAGLAFGLLAREVGGRFGVGGGLCDGGGGRR